MTPDEKAHLIKYGPKRLAELEERDKHNSAYILWSATHDDLDLFAQAGKEEAEAAKFIRNGLVEAGWLRPEWVSVA